MESEIINEKIHPNLKKLVIENGWKEFSEIQIKSFPIIYNGEDCIIEAPTSGGKTEAVLFPTLSRAAKNKKEGINILYVAPLKALLNNIDKRAQKYAETCGLHAFKWHGDVAYNKKVNEFNCPSELLLTTPESLEAILLRKSNWNEVFKNLECIIIDETHNFASGDRGIHLLSVLERLEYQLENLPQRIAVTATIGNPDDMLTWLAGKKRNKGKRIYATAKLNKEKDFKVHFYDSDKDINADTKLLKEMYDFLPNRKSLIFINSRSGSEIIAGKIKTLNSEIGGRNAVEVRTHHSSVSKFFREQAEFLIAIKNESGLQAIINTSTLELGIDIGELDQVVQINSLSCSSSLLQRVGRTGRRENKPQILKAFVNQRTDFIILIAVINLTLRGISEKIYFYKKAFHILSHQLICLSLQMHGISSDLAWQILSNVYSFSNISREEFDEMISYMVKIQIMRFVDSELVISELGEKKFLGANWRNLFAVFNSAPLYEVTNGKNQVGTLDANFVEGQKTPFLFMLGGMEWIANEVKYKTRQVVAKKTGSGKAPKWKTASGTEIPFETAQEIGRILFNSESPIFLDLLGLETLKSLRDEIKNVCWKSGQIIISKNSEEDYDIYTFAGCKINRTLAIMLNIYGIGITSSDHISVNIKSNIVDFEINQPINIDNLGENIEKFFEQVNDLSSQEISELQNKFEENLKEVPFSKFSQCLSSSLNKKTLSEKVFDLDAVLGLVNNSFIRVINN